MDYGAALETGLALGRIWFHLLPIRRRTVTRALSSTFPTWRRERIARTALEVFTGCAANATTLLWATAEATRPADILEVVRFEGLERYEREAATGVVLAASHTGSWDLAALAACAMGVRLSVVSRNLSYGPLDRMWSRRRARAGLRLLDESQGLGSITAAAGAGRALGLLVDQRTGPEMGGIRLPFLGREAWTTTLPAAVALRKDLPILPVFSRLEPDGTLCVSCGTCVRPGSGGSAVRRIREITAALSGALEDWIWLHPGSWLWLHRRWASAGAGEGAAVRSVRKVT
jgi:KDO2-lipid IV(A) lauroyltransferase